MVTISFRWGNKIEESETRLLLDHTQTLLSTCKYQYHLVWVPQYLHVTFMCLISLLKMLLYSLTDHKEHIKHPASPAPVFPPFLWQHQLPARDEKRRLSSPPGAHALTAPSSTDTGHEKPVHKLVCSAKVWLFNMLFVKWLKDMQTARGQELGLHKQDIYKEVAALSQACRSAHAVFRLSTLRAVSALTISCSHSRSKTRSSLFWEVPEI